MTRRAEKLNSRRQVTRNAAVTTDINKIQVSRQMQERPPTRVTRGRKASTANGTHASEIHAHSENITEQESHPPLPSDSPNRNEDTEPERLKCRLCTPTPSTPQCLIHGRNICRFDTSVVESVRKRRRSSSRDTPAKRRSLPSETACPRGSRREIPSTGRGRTRASSEEGHKSTASTSTSLVSQRPVSIQSPGTLSMLSDDIFMLFLYVWHGCRALPKSCCLALSGHRESCQCSQSLSFSHVCCIHFKL